MMTHRLRLAAWLTAVYAIDYVSTLEGGGSLDRTLNDSLEVRTRKGYAYGST